MIASELTKLFERKYHGSLKELNELISNDEKVFENGGEMSYMLFPAPNKKGNSATSR